MAKSASERRFQKRAAELGSLLLANELESFQRVWQTPFKGWVETAHFHARAQRREASPESIPDIYEVFIQARKLTVTIGAERDPKVADTLLHLEHLCAKAVALVTDPKFYRFDRYCTARLREASVRNRDQD